MHVQEEHLEQYALGELPKELAGTVESHLKECEACGVQVEQSRAILGAGSKKSERRRSPRTATDDPAFVTIIKPERSQRMKARVLDASKEGLKVLVPNPLMAGMIVQVNVRGLFIMGEVRYSRRSGVVYHAGILIQDVFPAAG